MILAKSTDNRATLTGLLCQSCWAYAKRGVLGVIQCHPAGKSKEEAPSLRAARMCHFWAYFAAAFLSSAGYRCRIVLGAASFPVGYDLTADGNTHLVYDWSPEETILSLVHSSDGMGLYGHAWAEVEGLGIVDFTAAYADLVGWTGNILFRRLWYPPVWGSVPEGFGYYPQKGPLTAALPRLIERKLRSWGHRLADDNDLFRFDMELDIIRKRLQSFVGGGMVQ